MASSQPSSSPISSRTKECVDLFERLINPAPQPDDQTSSRHLVSEASDGLGRFRIWAGNIGAFQRFESRSSLDYRLRDAKKISFQIVGLLDDLVESLEDACSIVFNERENRTSAVRSLDASDVDGHYDGLEQGGKLSEIKEIFSAIVDCINSLFRFSIIIRNNTNRDRYAKAIVSSLGDPILDKYDINHVREKFPALQTKGKEWLVTRLGKAITQRRHYLRYCREHHHRTSNEAVNLNVEGHSKDTKEPPALQEATAHTVGGMSALSKPPSTLAQTQASTLILNASQALEEEDPVDAQSQTSYATSSEEDSSSSVLHVVQVDEVSKAMEHYECIYCWQIQTYKTQRAWKKHVLSDLQAYVCTYENCVQKLFKDRHTWFSHELQDHRREWHCRFCKHQPFDTASKYQSHLSSKHSHLIAEGLLPTLLEMSQLPINKINPSDCPFCDDWELRLRSINPEIPSFDTLVVTQTQFKHHVGNHMEQLALFAIPRGYTEAGDADSGKAAPGSDLSLPTSPSSARSKSGIARELSLCQTVLESIINLKYVDPAFYRAVIIPHESSVPASPLDLLRAIVQKNERRDNQMEMTDDHTIFVDLSEISRGLREGFYSSANRVKSDIDDMFMDFRRMALKYSMGETLLLIEDCARRVEHIWVENSLPQATSGSNELRRATAALDSIKDYIESASIVPVIGDLGDILDAFSKIALGLRNGLYPKAELVKEDLDKVLGEFHDGLLKSNSELALFKEYTSRVEDLWALYSLPQGRHYEMSGYKEPLVKAKTSFLPSELSDRTQNTVDSNDGVPSHYRSLDATALEGLPEDSSHQSTSAYIASQLAGISISDTDSDHDADYASSNLPQPLSSGEIGVDTLPYARGNSSEIPDDLRSNDGSRAVEHSQGETTMPSKGTAFQPGSKNLASATSVDHKIHVRDELQSWIEDLVQMRRSGSFQLPDTFMVHLERCIQESRMGTEKYRGYSDPEFKQSLAAFAEAYAALGDNSGPNRLRVDNLVLLFHAKAEDLQGRQADETAAWKLVVDRHVALFVKLIIFTLEDSGYGTQKAELIDLLWDLESRLSSPSNRISDSPTQYAQSTASQSVLIVKDEQELLTDAKEEEEEILLREQQEPAYCKALTLRGIPCRLQSIAGQSYCKVHIDKQTADKRRASSKVQRAAYVHDVDEEGVSIPVSRQSAKMRKERPSSSTRDEVPSEKVEARYAVPPPRLERRKSSGVTSPKASRTPAANQGFPGLVATDSGRDSPSHFGMPRRPTATTAQLAPQRPVSYMVPRRASDDNLRGDSRAQRNPPLSSSAYYQAPPYPPLYSDHYQPYTTSPVGRPSYINYFQPPVTPVSIRPQSSQFEPAPRPRSAEGVRDSQSRRPPVSYYDDTYGVPASAVRRPSKRRRPIVYTTDVDNELMPPPAPPLHRIRGVYSPEDSDEDDGVNPVGQYIALPPRRPSVQRNSTSYDRGAEGARLEIAGQSRRRKSYYGSSPKVTEHDDYETTSYPAVTYPETLRSPTEPLTAESLKRQQLRYVKESASRFDTDYRRSATTRTTPSGTGDDDENMTIKVSGTAKLVIGGTQVDVGDGGEIRIKRRERRDEGSERAQKGSDDELKERPTRSAVVSVKEEKEMRPLRTSHRHVRGREDSE